MFPFCRNTVLRLMLVQAPSWPLSNLDSSFLPVATTPALRSNRSWRLLTGSALTWRRPGFSAG